MIEMVIFWAMTNCCLKGNLFCSFGTFPLTCLKILGVEVSLDEVASRLRVPTKKLLVIILGKQLKKHLQFYC